MNQSAQINDLAAALAKAQGQITGALKDSANPYFKSKYADLAACWDACRKALSENGLAVMQPTEEIGGKLYVVTTLAHASGQWVRGWMPVKTKDDGPQAMGSGVTYARRYALAAMVGLAQVDDDAEAAQGRRVDPADSGQKFPEDKLQAAAGRILDALNADLEEPDKAAAILAVQADLVRDQEFFAAAWKLLGPKERKAFKAYVDIARRAAA